MSGGPSYDADIATRIFDRMALGEALRHICASPDLPSMLTLKRWRKESKEFRQRWKQVMEQKRERAEHASW